MQMLSTRYAHQMKQGGTEKNHTLCWEQYQDNEATEYELDTFHTKRIT